jgi:hypothetical protein
LQAFSDNGDGSVIDSLVPDTGTQADTPPADGASAADRPDEAGAPPDGPVDAGATPDSGSPDAGTPACQGSSLAGRAEAPVTPVDLTAEGALDWRFWGPPGTVDFKRTAGNWISDYLPIGTIAPITRFRNAVTFSWSDGSPTLSSTAVADLLALSKMDGTGASITVPATATARTLSVYVGGDDNFGQFEASLSDGCVADYAATANDGRNAYTVAYRVTFKSATAGAVLRLRWTKTTGSNDVCLYAATLN